MANTLRNLLYVLKRFKLATITNLLGLSLSFLLFILIIGIGYHVATANPAPKLTR